MVSVIIATYNSSKYIIETLNSVINQTYNDIELIISDDCSTDDTVNICYEWLDSNRERFVNTSISVMPENKGIAFNYNNALRLAKGEWIKYLDSDDLLLPNCIQDNIDNSTNYPTINVWLSAWELIDKNGHLYDRQPNTFPMMSARKQLKSYLMHIQDLHSNTFFIRRSTLEMIGGFDERFPMTQDIPLVYNLLISGNRLGIMPVKYTVAFRYVPTSVSRSGNERMNNDIAECRWYYSRYFLRYGLVHYWYNAQVNHWLRKHRFDGITYKIFGYLLRCFDIVNIKTKLIKIFN